MNKKILIVAAHPDDEILGCSGSVTKLVNQGYEAHVLILSTGITSRLKDKGNKKKLAILKQQAKEANKIIGITNVTFLNLPDQKFDTVSILKIVQSIEYYIDLIKPEIVFTHFANDINKDHQITNEAVLTATRPMVGQSVKRIYAFEIVSSTEWNYPLTFAPNVYINIENTLKNKIDAMDCYQLELREYPHQRSLKNIELNAEYWGRRVGLDKAEAFQLLRNVIS